MNTNMYHNPILQDNLKKLEGYGFTVIAPEKGLLACRDIGDGKMPSEDVLVGYILREIAHEKDLAGMKVICHRRSDTGKRRPCALYYKPLHRKNGL